LPGVAYAIESALFQWEEGERRLSHAPPAVRAKLEHALEQVLEELRRRLGSAFRLAELAALYSTDADWALTIAGATGAGTDSSWAVDAAFSRYAREAADFGGGRPHDRLVRAE
jgi:hypothetical protein